MNAQHTPGPWAINKKYKFSVETVKDGQGINLIAECSDPDGIRKVGEDFANALLIAAAPELLEALEAIVKSLADQDDEGLIEHAQQMIDARAAIAKAKGE